MFTERRQASHYRFALLRWGHWQRGGLEATISGAKDTGICTRGVTDLAKDQRTGSLAVQLILAFQFLTRLPISISVRIDDKQLAGSMAFYPLVGLILGTGLGLIYTGLVDGMHLPEAPAAALVVIATVMLTGNLHLDGLMDTADGIYGGYTKERRLEIMRDSRVGAHGVAAAGLALLLRWSLLSSLPAAQAVFVLGLVMALSRWSLVYGAASYPYARQGPGLAKAYTEQVGPSQLLAASLTVIAVAAGAVYIIESTVFSVPWDWWVPVALAISGPAVALGTARYLTGKVGGITGDLLGALNEVVELFGLLLAVGLLSV